MRETGNLHEFKKTSLKKFCLLNETFHLNQRCRDFAGVLWHCELTNIHVRKKHFLETKVTQKINKLLSHQAVSNHIYSHFTSHTQ